MDRLFKIRCSQIGKIMGNSKPAGNLSATCKTYLEEWYANDYEQIHSKYFDKGNMVEQECIEFASQVLDLGFCLKNLDSMVQDEYFTGTCDVILSDAILDVKSPWNVKTLQDNVGGINTDYEWQGIGYMHLYKKEKFILFYGLMDTPEDANYGKEVIYSEMPDNERWLAYQIAYDQSKVDAIIEKVKQCRLYLEEYDAKIKNSIGKLTIIN